MKHKHGDSRAISTTSILAVNLLNKHGRRNGNARVYDTCKNKYLEIKGRRDDRYDSNHSRIVIPVSISLNIGNSETRIYKLLALVSKRQK